MRNGDATRPRMGFSGNALRRDGEARTEAVLLSARTDVRARVHLLGPDGWLTGGDDGFAFDLSRAAAMNAEDETLLGFDAAGAPVWVARVAAAPTDAVARSLRALGTADVLSPALEGALAQGEHLLNWHRRARFCGVCGGETAAEAGGCRRRCASCGAEHFPRTDPVAIMLVHDGAGRCLLGRGPHFAPGMVSCLAGFVEPGETLEAAVARETFEEAGVRVRSVRYLCSQPWPFPGSLMLGCVAGAEPGEVRFDPAELEACRWFGRDEVVAMLEERHADGLKLPQPFAIAHHLVCAWALDGKS